MKELRLLIADSDAQRRDRMTKQFGGAGYIVEAIGSASELLQSVLEKESHVLLLEDDFDRLITSADLVHLLKRCCHGLQVIMVCKDMPLALARQVHREGIFYCALRSGDAEDIEELQTAVACAFRKNRGERTPSNEDPPTTAPVGELRSRRGNLGWLRALPVLAGLGLLWCCAERATPGPAGMFYLFLGFGALIITTQLLPIFRITPPQWIARALAKRDRAAAKERY